MKTADWTSIKVQRVPIPSVVSKSRFSFAKILFITAAIFFLIIGIRYLLTKKKGSNDIKNISQDDDTSQNGSNLDRFNYTNGYY